MTRIQRSALVSYSAHEMFVLVADIASYPQFLPWCGGARVLSANEDEVIASIDIAYGGVHKAFTTRNLLQKDKMMELRLLEGPFSHLQGFWRFDPLDAQACRISFDLEFEISNKLLGVVLGKVFSTIAGEMVEGFHRRAQQLYGKRA
ncbi:MAG: ubiquinone-binding protein [Candidatus Muproteobacteria bacterium RBG_16_64_10]|uniref:Ubiquinone-binding protein n=1 Tax=Candidatus Muproteobacteria bacterium RBG_16_64_10 TaxID=1817757 RepID=A0A1F6T738_9PROT|nr:MAG: ubiquinone-binding protein [Candidatus Muproteobacteria bacterium RBG_16_64_10]